MGESIPRLVIAGLSGDSGKTLVSLSFLSALVRRGVQAAVFKKGPDYIDAAWLRQVSGSQCRNLDTYMVPMQRVRRRFVQHARKAPVAVIEGNRGLFDGKDSAGTHSTAELAKMIQSPVILVVNTTKTTRTLAALVSGCQKFDADLDIAGVVLNRMAGERHRRVVTRAIEEYCDLPVLGAIPKLEADRVLVPNRHLGLVPPSEFSSWSRFQESLTKVGLDYLDIDGLMNIADAASPLSVAEDLDATSTETVAQPMARMGYFEDLVFTFYYPENLEALCTAGARLVPISSLETHQLPEIDGLYIGGGFPETHAALLAENRSLMLSVKAASERGLPIYAECGGLIYLAESISVSGRVMPMCGVFPLRLEMSPKPVGHGYVAAEVDQHNPFFPIGTEILGHEFHYSGAGDKHWQLPSCLKMRTGTGLGQDRDGLIKNNTMACYSHIHADGVDTWADALVAQAAAYRRRHRGGIEGLD